MRREHGIFILEEETTENRVTINGFQGIILDVAGPNNESIRIGLGYYSERNGEYVAMTVEGIPREQILSIEKLKKFVHKFFEIKYQYDVEMGFPEIAVTKELRNLLVC